MTTTTKSKSAAKSTKGQANKPRSTPEKVVPALGDQKDSSASKDVAKEVKSAKPTKADIARKIYDEFIDNKDVGREQILEKFRKHAGLTKSGSLSYFYRFQKAIGRQSERGPTKMDKAREVFESMTKENKTRKEIMAVFTSSKVGLTKAGSSTYYQALKVEYAAK